MRTGFVCLSVRIRISNGADLLFDPKNMSGRNLIRLTFPVAKTKVDSDDCILF